MNEFDENWGNDFDFGGGDSANAFIFRNEKCPPSDAPSGASFERCDFSKKVFPCDDILFVTFCNCNMSETTFKPVGDEKYLDDGMGLADGVLFVNCDLSGAIFENCIFENARFVNCNLSGAKFCRCEINGSLHACGCDVTAMDLSHTDGDVDFYSDICFSGCNNVETIEWEM